MALLTEVSKSKNQIVTQTLQRNIKTKMLRSLNNIKKL